MLLPWGGLQQEDYCILGMGRLVCAPKRIRRFYRLKSWVQLNVSFQGKLIHTKIN